MKESKNLQNMTQGLILDLDSKKWRSVNSSDYIRFMIHATEMPRVDLDLSCKLVSRKVNRSNTLAEHSGTLLSRM